MKKEFRFCGGGCSVDAVELMVTVVKKKKKKKAEYRSLRD